MTPPTALEKIDVINPIRRMMMKKKAGNVKKISLNV